jgi:chemotaxis protein CheD
MSMVDYRPAAGTAIGVVDAPSGQEVNLLAGQLYFGQSAHRIRTLLGSCVGIALWHPRMRIGGMCHFLLPERPPRGGMPLDARFGREAFDLLLDAVARAGTQPQEYLAHLYGGADTMPDQLGAKFNVGERNIEMGWSLIDRHGFVLQEVDVGDHIPRTVRMDLKTGQVEMRRGRLTRLDGVAPRDRPALPASPGVTP